MHWYQFSALIRHELNVDHIELAGQACISSMQHQFPAAILSIGKSLAMSTAPFCVLHQWTLLVLVYLFSHGKMHWQRICNYTDLFK